MSDYDVEYTDMHQEDVFGQDFTDDIDDGGVEDEEERLQSQDDERDRRMYAEINRDNYSDFADPGGNSALRAASASNPRNLSCPTCRRPNKLTPKDVALGYQCDSCAERDEGSYAGSDY